MSNNETRWQELREFAAVDLTESFVLSWQLDGEYRISGKFGDIDISADRPILWIKSTIG